MHKYIKILQFLKIIKQSITWQRVVSLWIRKKPGIIKKYAFDTKSSTNNVKGTFIHNLGEWWVIRKKQSIAKNI
jgi:hypothetical protein